MSRPQRPAASLRLKIKRYNGMRQAMIGEHLTFRKAVPEDKPAVLAICAQIWEGDDYIPEVWDEWIADPYGQLSVVELEGKVVGLGKLTRLTPTEWWLEGLRVDPAYQGRGIGRFLHEQGVALADRLGRGVLRFATSSANHSVHRFAADTGFMHISSYVLFKGPASISPTAFTPLAEGDLDMASHFLEGSEHFQAAHRLCENRWWTWQTLTRELLSQYAAQGQLLGWRRRGSQLSGLALVSDYPREARLIVHYADAPGDLLSDLARDLRHLAGERGLELVDWKVFDRPDMRAALEAAGYENTWENTLWVFERPIRPRAADSEQDGPVETLA